MGVSHVELNESYIMGRLVAGGRSRCSSLSGGLEDGGNVLEAPD